MFDSEEGVAIKREITKGTLDDTSYQIIDGLKKMKSYSRVLTLKWKTAQKSKIRLLEWGVNFEY